MELPQTPPPPETPENKAEKSENSLDNLRSFIKEHKRIVPLKDGDKEYMEGINLAPGDTQIFHSWQYGKIFSSERPFANIVFVDGNNDIAIVDHIYSDNAQEKIEATNRGYITVAQRKVIDDIENTLSKLGFNILSPIPVEDQVRNKYHEKCSFLNGKIYENYDPEEKTTPTSEKEPFEF